MKDYEIHEFGIHIVEKDLRREGFQILSVNYQINIDPQIIARKNERLFHILVRTSCYPRKGKIEDPEIANSALLRARISGADCYFASIGIANANGTTDLEMSIPVRGAGFYIAYEGLVQLTPEYINILTMSSSSKAYNQYGNIAGSVSNLPDGRRVLNIGKDGDINSIIMSSAMIMADNLTREKQVAFSRWAHLPTNIWTTEHREFFSLALMHFLMDAKVRGANLPPEIMKAIDLLHPQALPDLPYPLDKTIINLFSGLFSGKRSPF